MFLKYRNKYKKGENEFHLDNQKYIELSSIIILLLALMLFIINIESLLRASEAKIGRDNYINLEKNDIFENIDMEKVDSELFTVVGDKSGFIVEGLKQSKTPHIKLSSLGDIKDIKGDLILDGNMIDSDRDVNILKQFIDKKKTIIFLTMPSEKQIIDYKLKEILGIARVKGKKNEKQLNIVPGFLLGGVHEFKKIKYETYDLDLLFTTKTFAYGKDHSPVIWRNTYDGSEIYIINGPFMDTNISYGFLSALMCQIHEDYIYPIVNARLMTYEGLPYISYENKEKLESLYNRDAMKFQKDILLSNILTISNTRNFVANGYFRLGFDREYKENLFDKDIKLIRDISTQIYNNGGQVGLRYSGDIELDKKTYSDLFKNEDIKSVIVDEEIDDFESISKSIGLLESIVGPWKSNHNFGFIDKNTVYIPITVEGVGNSTEKELEMLSGIMAFGAIVQNLDLEEFVMWTGESENITKQSLEYMKFLDKYRKKFSFIQNKNTTQIANSVKIFRNNNPVVKYSSDKIEMNFKDWYGDSYFIFKTEKDIDKVMNGQVKKIEDGFYLLTATDKNIEILLSKPKNTEASR